MIDSNEENKERLPSLKGPNLFDQAVGHLSPESKQRLGEKIVQTKVELDAEEIKAAQRLHYSGEDMKNTIDQVRDLERSPNRRFSVESTYQTASGQTTVKIQKNNIALLLVIALLVGIVIAFLLLR